MTQRSQQILFALSLAAAACSSARPRSDVIPESQLGTYDFLERITGGNALAAQGEVLQGTVTILRDSVIVDMSPGPCSYEIRSATSPSISYRCAGVLVTFDRSNPVLRANYNTSVIERVPVRVCVRYATNSSGQQVCTQWGTDYEERRATRTGTLRLNKRLG
ncbi:MAG TPA: hypothetical protein VEB19_05925 [Gemmatimonadaceae bacterium]|nr:hypothetical protein [Gemmatimonadaceae bacterium]